MKSISAFTSLETLVQLLCGFPILFILAIIATRFFKDKALPIVVIGFVLLLATPVSVNWTANLWTIITEKPVNISCQKIVESKITYDYFSGSYSSGTGMSGRGKSDIYQVYLPLENDLIILYEYSYSHTSGYLKERGLKSIEFAKKKFSEQTIKYAMRIEHIRSGSTYNNQVHLPADSMIRVITTSNEIWSNENFIYYLIFFIICCFILIAVNSYLIIKDKMGIL